PPPRGRARPPPPLPGLRRRRPDRPRPLHQAQDARPEEIRRRHPQEHRGLRHRPRRPRQDPPGHGRRPPTRRNPRRFGPAPAGTGKPYLAMAVAVQALMAKQVNRLILTRPAVEAGEKLGFLPGTLSQKVDPSLLPPYDALYEMIDAEQIGRMMERGTIEVAPLAYMRGRSQPHDRQVL